MKITNKRENEMSYFRNLAHGEVFLDEDDDVYMTLAGDVTTGNGYAANAVALDSGIMRWFDEYDRVHQVGAELTIT